MREIIERRMHPSNGKGCGGARVSSVFVKLKCGHVLSRGLSAVGQSRTLCGECRAVGIRESGIKTRMVSEGVLWLAKIGTQAGTWILVRGDAVPEKGVRIAYKEEGSTPFKNMRWSTGVVDRVEGGRAFVEMI